MMDITMPEMDGIQALKKIKEMDPGAQVIMCSAMGPHTIYIADKCQRIKQPSTK